LRTTPPVFDDPVAEPRGRRPQHNNIIIPLKRTGERNLNRDLRLPGSRPS
jgi:hypothetical protein